MEEDSERMRDFLDMVQKIGDANMARLCSCSIGTVHKYRHGLSTPKPKFWTQYGRMRWRMVKIAETWRDEVLAQRIAGAAVRHGKRKEACRRNFERVRDEEMASAGRRIAFNTFYQYTHKAADGCGFIYVGAKKTYRFGCDEELAQKPAQE